jgi:ribosomal protein S16
MYRIPVRKIKNRNGNSINYLGEYVPSKHYRSSKKRTSLSPLIRDCSSSFPKK